MATPVQILFELSITEIVNGFADLFVRTPHHVGNNKKYQQFDIISLNIDGDTDKYIAT